MVTDVCVSVDDRHVGIRGLNLSAPVRLLAFGDAHLTVDDERGLPYKHNSSRMAGYAQGPELFHRLLEEGLERCRPDLVLLLGDMVSFPSWRGVEVLQEELEACGVPYAYTAGNHDWHYEGLPGTELALREEWTERVLKPLYQGRDPLCQRIELGGMQVVLVDTSANEIVESQLKAWESCLAHGLPTLVGCHVPLYVPGRTPGDCSVGHPDWNSSTDVNWEIERRPRWPESGHSPVTMGFWESVFGSEHVLGVVAGHTHKESFDFYRGIFQVVVASAARGGYVDIECY